MQSVCIHEQLLRLIKNSVERRNSRFIARLTVAHHFWVVFFFLRPFLQGFKKRHTLVIPFRSINCLWNPLFKMIIFVVTFKVGILILLD